MWPEKLIFVTIMVLYTNVYFLGDLEAGGYLQKSSRIKVVRNNKYQFCSDKGLDISMKH